MRESSTLEIIRRAAEPHGLNLVAATPAARYDAAVKEISRASAIDPLARTIVVIGNGGGALWNALKSHAANNPGWWSRENPLDDFTRDVVERDIASPLRASGLRCTTVYPFMNNGRTLSFIELGKVAGIAGPSILGVTVHPYMDRGSHFARRCCSMRNSIRRATRSASIHVPVAPRAPASPHARRVR